MNKFDNTSCLKKSNLIYFLCILVRASGLVVTRKKVNDFSAGLNIEWLPFKILRRLRHT